MKIGIVGGGLGGLTLARVLPVNGIQSTVYGLDPVELWPVPHESA